MKPRKRRTNEVKKKDVAQLKMSVKQLFISPCVCHLRVLSGCTQRSDSFPPARPSLQRSVEIQGSHFYQPSDSLHEIPCFCPSLPLIYTVTFSTISTKRTSGVNVEEFILQLISRGLFLQTLCSIKAETSKELKEITKLDEGWNRNVIRVNVGIIWCVRIGNKSWTLRF